MLIGAAFPFSALLVCWGFGASLSTAVAVASWTSAAIVIATEIVLGLRAELEGKEMVIQTGVGVLLGLLIVAMRVLLHERPARSGVLQTCQTGPEQNAIRHVLRQRRPGWPVSRPSSPAADGARRPGAP